MSERLWLTLYITFFSHMIVIKACLMCLFVAEWILSALLCLMHKLDAFILQIYSSELNKIDETTKWIYFTKKINLAH